MKKFALAAVALMALAACQQAVAPEPQAEAAAPPASLLEQVQAQSGEQQLVTAYQALIAYQQAHPEAVQPPCNAVRSTQSYGVVPENVAPGVYAGHAGAAAYSVQCGELRSQTRFDAREHWLVLYAPGATEVAVVNCADAHGNNACFNPIPTTGAAAPASP